ncbi:hypothetical protein BgiMline_025075, partial [Biomphalaria glabrata]
MKKRINQDKMRNVKLCSGVILKLQACGVGSLCLMTANPQLSTNFVCLQSRHSSA